MRVIAFIGECKLEMSKVRRTLISYLALLLVALVAPALSCPPPLNNFDFIGNQTHTSAQLIEASLAQQGALGWVKAVSDWLKNPVKIWPRDSGQNTHIISYCYANEYVKSKLGTWVTQSLEIWIHKVGVPGHEYNHGLQF
jgi:hypothetical protein